MKKYVLNIERLFTGETANALVLNQVDEELPTLLPSMTSGAVEQWVRNCREIYPDFYPEFDPEQGITQSDLNDVIVEFNLKLQEDFKKRGHQELYLMDDTKWMRPSKSDSTFATDKINMHLLNGQVEMAMQDTHGNVEENPLNSSQLNVLFPFRKVSSKSLYSEQLVVESPYELDDNMENSRQMSLQGKDSSLKCVQGIATVGGNLYAMSPLVESVTQGGNLIANGMSIVNSFVEKPYHFPHTMTLFQPSRDRYDDPNMAKDENGLTPFIAWYKTHNRRTVVSTQEEYGSNISNFKCNGAGSYEIDLATYAPTGIVLGDNAPIPLSVDKFRQIRAEQDERNTYTEFTTLDENGNEVRARKYVFHNGEDEDTVVGFDFNLYDNFITGNERTLRLTVPKDKDFNRLHLRFECDVHHLSGLLGRYEYIVFIGDHEKFRYSGGVGEKPEQDVDFLIRDAVLEAHTLDIKVIVHYQVDFTRRNNETEYQGLLKNSGITLKDIRIDNDVVQTKRQLTFADYVNEVGIPSSERERRYAEFWQVSQYKRDIPYQLIVETSLKNVTTSGISYPNNYSTGDIYGDVFTTKSVLDPNYDMNLKLDYWNDNESRWATEEEIEDEHMDEFTTQMIHAVGREYIDLGQCSNQLFLVFKPTDVAIGYETEWKDLDGDDKLDPDERIVTKRS